MIDIKILKINMILMGLIWMVDIKILKKKYDLNGFDINGKHKDTKNKYDPNGFDIKGKHKDTDTFLNKENDIRKDISKNINWLKDKNEFLKLYDEIIENGEFSETINKKVISSNIF